MMASPIRPKNPNISREVANLIQQAESLLRKKIAIKESVPGVFEALSNVDDQLRKTINEIIASGQDDELDQNQIRLINTALVGTRTAISTYQADYRPNVNDLTAEFAMLPQVDLRQLRKLKDDDRELYDSLVNKHGVIRETDFSTTDLTGDDIAFLEDKEAIINILKKYDNGGYIDDNVWYAIVSEGRIKQSALWNSSALPTAAKFMQERYGFEFAVKYLEYPERIEGGVRPIEGGDKAESE
jgi:hypothetical protein